MTCVHSPEHGGVAVGCADDDQLIKEPADEKKSPTSDTYDGIPIDNVRIKSKLIVKDGGFCCALITYTRILFRLHNLFLVEIHCFFYARITKARGFIN